MNLLVNPFALILLVSGLATIFTALVIYKRIRKSELSFALLLGLSGWWALTYSIELFSTSYSSMLFWLKLEYIGICLLPPTLFIFIRAFISSQRPIIKPFYALLFDQILRRKGFTVRVWLKSASIQYLKPGRTNLYFKIVLTDDDINEAEKALNTVGKFVKAFPMEIINSKGEVCASVVNEVYVRNLFSGEERTIAY